MANGQIKFTEWPGPSDRGDRADNECNDDLNFVRGPNLSNLSPRPGTRSIAVLPTTIPVTSPNPPTLLSDTFHLCKRVGGANFFTQTRADRNEKAPGYGSVLMVPAIAAVGGSAGFAPSEPDVIPTLVEDWLFAGSFLDYNKESGELTEIIADVADTLPQVFGPDVNGVQWSCLWTGPGPTAWTSIDFFYRIDGETSDAVDGSLSGAAAAGVALVSATPRDDVEGGMWVVIDAYDTVEPGKRSYSLYSLDVVNGLVFIDVLATDDDIAGNGVVACLTNLSDGDLLLLVTTNTPETWAVKFEPYTGAVVEAEYPVEVKYATKSFYNVGLRCAALIDGRVAILLNNSDDSGTFAGLVAFVFDDDGVGASPAILIDLSAFITENRMFWCVAWPTVGHDDDPDNMNAIVVVADTGAAPEDWTVQFSADGMLSDITTSVTTDVEFGFTADQLIDFPLWSAGTSLYLGGVDTDSGSPAFIELTNDTGSFASKTIATDVETDRGLLVNSDVNFDPDLQWMRTMFMGLPSS